MLRPLLLLVAVSACASSAPGVRVNAPSVSPSDPSARHASARASDAPKETGARLAPPFGGTAGVRRVGVTSAAVADTVPDVVAAVDPQE